MRGLEGSSPNLRLSLTGHYYIHTLNNTINRHLTLPLTLPPIGLSVRRVSINNGGVSSYLKTLPTHSTFKCPGEECPRGTGSTNLTVLPECVFDVQRTERSWSYTWIRNQSSLSLATGSLFTLFHSVLWMTWFHSPRSLTPSTPFLPLLSSTHSLTHSPTQSVIPSQTYPSPFRTFYIRWFKRGSVPTELTKTASDGVNVHPTSHHRHRIRSLLPARP